MRKKKIPALVFIMLFASSFVSEAQSPVKRPPTAQMIAEIDAMRPLEPQSPEVTRAKAALDAAERLCKNETEDHLADMAVTTKDILKKEQIVAYSVDILEGIKAIFAGETGIDCADAMVTYVSVRKSGMTHSETVAGLRSVILTARDLVGKRRSHTPAK